MTKLPNWLAFFNATICPGASTPYYILEIYTSKKCFISYNIATARAGSLLTELKGLVISAPEIFEKRTHDWCNIMKILHRNREFSESNAFCSAFIFKMCNNIT